MLRTDISTDYIPDSTQEVTIWERSYYYIDPLLFRHIQLRYMRRTTVVRVHRLTGSCIVLCIIITTITQFVAIRVPIIILYRTNAGPVTFQDDLKKSNFVSST